MTLSLNTLFARFISVVGFLIFTNHAAYPQSKANVNIAPLYPKIAAAEIGSKEYHALLFELIDQCRANQPDSVIKYAQISLKHNPNRLQPYHFRAGYMMADAWSIKGNFTLADSLFSRIEDEFHEVSDSLHIGDYFNSRGINYIERGQSEASIASFKQAHNYIQYSHPDEASKCIANIASIFSEMDMEDSCLYYNFKALDMRLANKDTNGMETSYCNIGTVYFKRKEYRRTIDYTSLGDQLRGLPDYKICAVAINLINSYKHLGMRDSAFYWVENNLASAYAMNSTVLIARGLFQKGELFRRYGQNDSSLFYMLKAFPDLEANNDTIGNRVRYYELGATYLELKNYKKANDYLDIAFRYAEQFNDRKHLLAARRDLAKAKLGLLGREDLIRFYEDTEQLADSLHALELASIEHELLIQFETEKTENALKTSELALLSSRGMVSTQRVYIIGLLVLCLFLLILILVFRYNRRLKQLKQEEEEKNRENQESMRMVLSGEEQERQRIARELHDGLGQQLTLIRMKTDLLLDEMSEPKESTHAIISSLQSEVASASEELRNISHAMMPANLELGSLVDALRGLFRRDYESIGLEIELKEQLAPHHQLTKASQHAIYRICQEAISNSQKHGEAESIHIHLHSNEHYLFLEYRDNGTGFMMGQVKPGLGLSNIRQRVQTIHGELSMESSLGKGFRMNIRFPVSACMENEA